MNVKLSGKEKEDLFNSSIGCKLTLVSGKFAGQATKSSLASKTIKKLKNQTSKGANTDEQIQSKRLTARNSIPYMEIAELPHGKDSLKGMVIK